MIVIAYVPALTCALARNVLTDVARSGEYSEFPAEASLKVIFAILIGVIIIVLVAVVLFPGTAGAVRMGPKPSEGDKSTG